MKPIGWYAVLAVGAAALVGVTYTVTTRRDRRRFAAQQQQNALPISPAPPVLPTPPAPPLVPAGSSTMLTVSPSTASQTVALQVQDPVLVTLPDTGSTWISADGAPIAQSKDPWVFVFLGPITHTFVWTDAQNVQHVSTYNFVLNPSATPVVTTT